ncbi:hypothetical protein M422DRAFT_183161, partial [Sphaerobolus stellatus SS14]
MLNGKGVAIILNKRYTTWKDAIFTDIIPGRALMLQLPRGEQGKLCFLAVYAPNDAGENTLFWKNLTKHWHEKQLPCVDTLLGDFNLVEDALDRNPPRIDPTAPVEALQEFKAMFSLQDGWRKTYPDKMFFTWTHGTTESRLDRIYMCKNLLKYSTSWAINPAPFQTDHDVVSCSILNPEEPFIGKGRWSIPPMVTGNKEFIRKVIDRGMELQTHLQTTPDERHSLQVSYAAFKKDILSIAKKYASKTASILDKKISTKESELNESLQSPGVDNPGKAAQSA